MNGQDRNDYELEKPGKEFSNRSLKSILDEILVVTNICYCKCLIYKQFMSRIGI